MFSPFLKKKFKFFIQIRSRVEGFFFNKMEICSECNQLDVRCQVRPDYSAWQHLIEVAAPSPESERWTLGQSGTRDQCQNELKRTRQYDSVVSPPIPSALPQIGKNESAPWTRCCDDATVTKQQDKLKLIAVRRTMTTLDNSRKFSRFWHISSFRGMEDDKLMELLRYLMIVTQKIPRRTFHGCQNVSH